MAAKIETAEMTVQTHKAFSPALEEEVRRITRDEMRRELARREHERRDVDADPTAEGGDDER